MPHANAQVRIFGLNESVPAVWLLQYTDIVNRSFGKEVLTPQGLLEQLSFSHKRIRPYLALLLRPAGKAVVKTALRGTRARTLVKRPRLPRHKPR